MKKLMPLGSPCQFGDDEIVNLARKDRFRIGADCSGSMVLNEPIVQYVRSDLPSAKAVRSTRRASTPNRCSQVVLRHMALALALPLAACQTPATRTQTVEVKVPVAVQPIKAEQVPAVPAPLGKRPPSLRQQADTLLAKVCEFVGYALRADPLLRVSAGQQPTPLPRYPECEPK